MDFDAIIKAGQNLAEPKVVGDGIPFAVIPEGSSVEDLEKLLLAPKRARGAVAAHDVATFNAYFNKFKGADSAAFGNQQGFQVVGIIDYHGPSTPAFREHRVTYTAPRSKEWETWKGANGRRMPQADFAQFIEDNVVDIRTPAGADVLEVSRNLQAQKAVVFNSALRLADGSQQFTYSETIDGSTAKGTIKVPEQFTLGIPVFFGGAPYEVIARLRYRINEGKLQMWFDLYRPEHIEQDAFAHVVAEVTEAIGTPVWMGVAG